MRRRAGIIHLGLVPLTAAAMIGAGAGAARGEGRSIVAWGDNYDGQCNVPDAPAAGASDSLSLPGRGQGEGRRDALRLIERALAVPEKLAAGLTAEQREKFLTQFAAWAKLAQENAQR